MSGPVGPAASVGLGSAQLAPMPVPSAVPSLLPAPTQAIGSIESLYALMAETSVQQQKTGKVEVQAKFEQKRAQFEKYVAQLKKAEQDRNSDNPFKTIATVAVVAVAAAATVATCGGAAPALVGVGLALSAGGFVVGETKCLDPVLGDGVSKWVGLGMGLAGTICTLGAGGSTAVEQFAQGAEGISTAAQGCATTLSAVSENRADHDMQRAKAAQNQMRRLQVAIDDIIERLGDEKDATRRGSDAVNQVVQTEGNTLIIAAGGRA
jgi:hypothetical protein